MYICLAVHQNQIRGGIMKRERVCVRQEEYDHDSYSLSENMEDCEFTDVKV